jgi:hypothetical protein
MNLWIGALHHTTAAMRFGRCTALSQIALRYAPWPSAHFALASAQQNVIYARNVVRQAERQDSEKENGLMINTFLNPAPRTPLTLIESRQVHGGLKRRTF